VLLTRALVPTCPRSRQENIALRVFTRSGVIETLMAQLSQRLSTQTDVYFARKALLLVLQLVGGEAQSDEPVGEPSKAATRRCAHVVNLSKVEGGGYGGLVGGSISGGGFAEHIITGTRNLHLLAASRGGRLEPYDPITRRRNPWHSLWCTSMIVFTSALRTLGRADGTLEDAIIFAGVHRHEFQMALEVLPMVSNRYAPRCPLAHTHTFTWLLSRRPTRWYTLMSPPPPPPPLPPPPPPQRPQQPYARIPPT
jgi:hypothetical protein